MRLYEVGIDEILISASTSQDIVMSPTTPRFGRCADIALEAERLLAAGEVRAAEILHRNVADTCVFGPSPCPKNSECRVVVARVAAKLAAGER